MTPVLVPPARTLGRVQQGKDAGTTERVRSHRSTQTTQATLTQLMCSPVTLPPPELLEPLYTREKRRAWGGCLQVGCPTLQNPMWGNSRFSACLGTRGGGTGEGGECAGVREGCSFGVQIPGRTPLSPGSVERGGEREPDFALRCPGTTDASSLPPTL